MKIRPLFLNQALEIMVITNAVVVFASAMLGPIYAIFVNELGGDLLDAGLTAGIYAFVAGVVTLIAGRYTDKLKEKEYILVFGYILNGIGFALFTQVSSIWALFAVQAFIGLADALLSPAFDAIYSTHLNRGREGIQWSLYGAGTYFATALGMAAGALVVTTLGFNFLFWLMAFLCWASAVYIIFLPRKVL